MTYLDQPLSHWARRTSTDTVREACAIHAFKRRMPASEKVLYALAPVCVLMAILFNQWGA